MSPGSLLLARPTVLGRALLWEAIAGGGIGTEIVVPDLQEGTPMLALFCMHEAGSDYVLVLVAGQLGYVFRGSCQEVVS